MVITILTLKYHTTCLHFIQIDYMERAKRLEEIPLLQNAYEEFLVKDTEFWEQQEAERIKEAIVERELALQTSERLLRIRKDKDEFFNKLKSDRGSDFKVCSQLRLTVLFLAVYGLVCVDHNFHC